MGRGWSTWKKTTYWHTKNMQTPHSQDFNQEPSRCAVTVLTTTLNMRAQLSHRCWNISVWTDWNWMTDRESQIATGHFHCLRKGALVTWKCANHSIIKHFKVKTENVWLKKSLNSLHISHSYIALLWWHHPLKISLSGLFSLTFTVLLKSHWKYYWRVKLVGMTL